MGAVPVISEVVDLATVAVSLRVTAPTSGAGYPVVSYTVAVGATTLTGLGFTPQTENGVVMHYITCVPTSSGSRGAVANIVVTAVGGSGSAASAAVIHTWDPVTSYAGTVRQKVCDLLRASALSVKGDVVTVLADLYGRPRSIQVTKPIGEGIFPLVEVGVPMAPGSTPVDNILHRLTVGIPVRVIDAARDFDEGGERAHAALELVRARLDGTANLGLHWFGVTGMSWEWSGGGAPEMSPDGKLVSVRTVLSVPVTVQAGEALA